MQPQDGDDFLLDTPVVRAFVAAVRESITTAASPENACDTIRPRFAELLADRTRLPVHLPGKRARGGMGGGIGQ